jgi:hypothetical protein
MTREMWSVVCWAGLTAVGIGLVDVLASQLFDEYRNSPVLDAGLVVGGLIVAMYASRKNHSVGNSGCSRCGGGPISMILTGFGSLCHDCARKTNFSSK